MTDLQFERTCNVVTILSILLALGTGMLTFMVGRARSVWQYQIDLKRAQDIIDYARKEYVLIRRTAIMTSVITLVVVAFRVWAYVFRGV